MRLVFKKKIENDSSSSLDDLFDIRPSIKMEKDAIRGSDLPEDYKNYILEDLDRLHSFDMKYENLVCYDDRAPNLIEVLCSNESKEQVKEEVVDNTDTSDDEDYDDDEIIIIDLSFLEPYRSIILFMIGVMIFFVIAVQKIK